MVLTRTKLPLEIAEAQRLEAFAKYYDLKRRQKGTKSLAEGSESEGKYYLNPKHRKFFEFDTRVQGLIGANRSGKTQSVWYKVERLCEGTHPAQLAGKFPMPPLKGRIAGSDFSVLEEVYIECMIPEWLPTDWKYEWNSRSHVLKLTNPSGITSVIFFNTYDQKVAKHASLKLNFVVFDEEPPRKHYKENRMRLLDLKGWMMFGFTADQGFTWAREEIVEAAKKDDQISVIHMRIWDNINEKGDCRISLAEIASITKGLTPAERKIKLEGEIAALGGLVWGEFTIAKHVLDDDIKIPSEWTRYCVIDGHERTPTHVSWFALNREEQIYLYNELAIRGTVKEIAEAMKETERDESGVEICQYLIDPSSKKDSITGDVVTSMFDELISENITPLLEANRNRVGRALFRGWLIEKDKFFVLPRCVGHIKQIQMYQYDEDIHAKKLKNPRDEVMKFEDHYCDNCKYLANHKPWYSSEMAGEKEDSKWEKQSA